VAEVVGVAREANGCFHRLRPGPAPEVVGSEGAAVVSCEDEGLQVPAAAGDEGGNVRGEFVDDGAWHGDRAPSRLRLRRPELDVALGFGQRLLNRQDPTGEVHVPDPQCCQLADAKTRVCGREHERPVPGRHRLRQGEDLLLGEDTHPPWVVRRQDDSGAGTPCNPLPHGRPHDPGQCLIGLLDRGRCVARLGDLLDPFLHEVLVDGGDGHVLEGRKDEVLEHPGIPQAGVVPEVDVGGLEPVRSGPHVLASP